MKTKLFLIIGLFPFFALLTSCKKKGPAEKAGEHLDKATEHMQDAFDPKGPGERAGEKLDKALGN